MRSHTTVIILMLVGINLSLFGVLLRLRRIEKGIYFLPNIIKNQAEGRERYVELLERQFKEKG